MSGGHFPNVCCMCEEVCSRSYLDEICPILPRLNVRKRHLGNVLRSHSEDIQQHKFQSENFMWHSSWNPAIKPYCLSTISCVTQSFCSCCCATGGQCQVVAWICHCFHSCCGSNTSTLAAGQQYLPLEHKQGDRRWTFCRQQTWSMTLELPWCSVKTASLLPERFATSLPMLLTALICGSQIWIGANQTQSSRYPPHPH